MGNEHSQMSSLVIEEKAIEVSDFYSHHTATLKSGNITTVSVFQSEPIANASLWVAHTPLEKASKNLMIHRHPCILRYISSWSKGSKHFLAVEQVKPLNQVLSAQSPLQICIGLHSILKALVFLHEKAHSSHNNVCTCSIYVTVDGNWKLGGLEYMCKYSDVSTDFLSKSRKHRYSKAIDPNEEKNAKSKKKDFIDVYAFAILVSEVFRNKSDESIPSLEHFLNNCKAIKENPDVNSRPTLGNLMQDLFFNHEFVIIHSFLCELPLKSHREKEDFFTTLLERLKSFNESTVAAQLGSLLLSRLVLLNKTAQKEVLPCILSPRSKNEQTEGLFAEKTFAKFIVPKLLEIFTVRDAQIRLLLLEHLNSFVRCFTKEQLQSKILPELLVGIKDTNDHLVSVTLRSLADLVPILGSAIVIGGSRAKLFNDGLPCPPGENPVELEPLLVPIASNDLDVLSTTSSAANLDLNLNERPSPDGEEGESSTVTDELDGLPIEDQSNEWDDWDINEENQSQPTSIGHYNLNENGEIANGTIEEIQSIDGKLVIPDITELDIKMRNDKKKNSVVEIDFFQDMEPVIEAPAKFVVENAESKSESSLLDVKNSENHEEGWDDDLEWD